MNKAPIFYVMGVSGCGKSTIGKLLAEQFDIPFFDGDDYHPEANLKKMASGKPLNDHDRQGWLEQLNALSIENKKKGLVIACSALKEHYRKILSVQIDSQVEFIHLEGTFENITDRLNKRENHFMPPGLLQSQFDDLETPLNAITVSILNAPREIVEEITTLYNIKKP